MAVTTDLITYTARRVVLTSPKPIDEVLAVLNQELNKEKEGQVGAVLMAAQSREEIDRKFAELYECGRTFVYVATAHATLCV